MRVTRARHSPVITRRIHRDGQAGGQPAGQGLVLDQWGPRAGTGCDVVGAIAQAGAKQSLSLEQLPQEWGASPG